MRQLILISAVALAAAGLAGCDNYAFTPGKVQTAAAPAASQCAPAPAPACPGAKTAGAVHSAASTTTVVRESRGGGYRQRAGYTHHRRNGGRYSEGGVEHYGYVNEDDAYASGATSRSGYRVSRTEGYSSSERYSESSSASYAGGSSYESGYASGGAWASSGHQGRLIIRGRHGQGDSWTWRTAGHDEQGYLTWPGKSPR